MAKSVDITKIDELCKIIRQKWNVAKVTDKPNTLVSLAYWTGDLCIAYALWHFFATYQATLQGYIGYFMACFVSAIVQGTAWTGLWVLGHECGHGAFSANKSIETAVGYLTHTALLVPYFSWQFTHAKHHRYTNHLTKGETHVPNTKQDASLYQPVLDALGDDGFAIFQLFVHLVLGWPVYLFQNGTGGSLQADLKTPIDQNAAKSHFVPCQIFPANMSSKVTASSMGCVAMLSTLFLLQFKGVDTLYFYWMPYLVVNGWLVLYTWLQHTDPSVPHFGDDIHTFNIGAISTIDRPYPWLIDTLHHHIGSTHVAHHLNHHIPHYRAQAATDIVRETLGDGYNFIDTGIASASVFVAKTCHYVEDTKGVQYLKTMQRQKTA